MNDLPSCDLFPAARHDALNQRLDELHRWLGQPKKGFVRYRHLLEQVGHLRAEWFDASGDTVIIGSGNELKAEDRDLVRDTLRALMPWRKGPFSVFGIDIDAEWRSERKWNRILPYLPDLEDRIIADIGSSNGYYMFRMLAHNPRFILGFEPSLQHYHTFRILNTFARRRRLRTEPLGIEDLDLFPDSFDVLFCLGILYHRRSPLEGLAGIRRALKPGGTVIVESQAIPGPDPVALFPEKTYAKVPGTWFVPTPACLANWLKRTGFTDIEQFALHPMSSREQRRTDWMVYESFQDFIDPDDPARTVEGYPAPWRVFFRARKKSPPIG